MSAIYDLSCNDTMGNHMPLGDFRGKVLLFVNTATHCGFAPQLTELEALHQEYKDKGLVVVGLPCNQFGNQEPETNDTVAQVCQMNFGVTFRLTEKIDVNGANEHPLLTYLKAHSQSVLGKDIKWNFTKFLVSRDGETIMRYAPSKKPTALRSKIEELLAQTVS